MLKADMMVIQKAMNFQSGSKTAGKLVEQKWLGSGLAEVMVSTTNWVTARA